MMATLSGLDPLAEAQLIAAVAQDKLAQDVVILDMRPVTVFTDFFVIATGQNERQTKGINDEVYVLIVRDSAAASTQVLPPVIALNTVPERERLIQEHGDNRFDAIWNPCDWKTPWTELDVKLSPELNAMCAIVNQDIWQNDRYDEAIVFMFRLAQALNKAQLPIRRADEFVSILLSEEQGDLEAQVEQQIIAATRKKLQRGGWLPE